jgi:hypothetical protein
MGQPSRWRPAFWQDNGLTGLGFSPKEFPYPENRVPDPSPLHQPLLVQWFPLPVTGDILAPRQKQGPM